ncbi:MAG: cytidylate kinase [Halobacteriovoraceae bacterium]|nr:cytidylate kinase [Halobacteriovoraceae bacterium]|tara:strand:- start:5888 stop:6580 length:693 start_codon:yes stop_codon:yes gene_type:complete
MKTQKVIAIDGPSGSGKSTIAKSLSLRLGLTYLDTGAMFRALAWALDDKQIAPDDDQEIRRYLSESDFKYAPSESVLIELNGKDLTHVIREHHVSHLASQYSKNTSIRNYLKHLQRDIASRRPSVLEGRDIGTVIFPDAVLKFFLTAKPRVRAQRRYQQLEELGQDMSQVDIDSITKDIELRDQEDRNRKHAPLLKADDAIEIDTSTLTIDNVISIIEDYYQKNIQSFKG